MDHRQPRLRPILGNGLRLTTGKTVTTLTALDILLTLGEVNRVLVIAPKRVAEDTWSKETAKWEHLQHLRIAKMTGSAKDRLAALAADADIYVINRENVQWLCEACESLKVWPWDTVVIDELSSFKSASAKRFRALRKFRGRMERVIGLTGTPASNGLIDLWPQIYLLDRGERLERTITAYRDKYFTPDRMNGHIVYSYRLKPGSEEAIYTAIEDICMSLRKEDVLQLPGQVYENIELTLTDQTMKQYKKFERDQVMKAMDDNGTIIAQNAASLTNKLLQFANGAIYDESHNVHHIHDVKLDALEELIEEANGEPVLVLYAYQHDADRIRERITCRSLDTSEDISAWNRGEIPVALAHPASIGHGLNLQDGGHIIIWYGLTWSLELYQQANERLNRPGQKNVCRIYHLVIKGTHDERVLCALEAKDITQQGLINALLLDMEE